MKHRAPALPSCYQLRPTPFWNPVERTRGCRDCPFRMSCKNPENTGIDAQRTMADVNDYDP